MESFECSLEETDRALCCGDFKDWAHGHSVVKRNVAVLSRESDPIVRLTRSLEALRVLSARHKRLGRFDLADEVAGQIAAVERRVWAAAQLAGAELHRRRLSQ